MAKGEEKTGEIRQVRKEERKTDVLVTGTMHFKNIGKKRNLRG